RRRRPSERGPTMDPQAAPPNKTPRPRRWRLRALVCTPLAVLCLVTLLHPYLRQSLFGPTVRGKPLCYWQDQFRARAEPDEYRNSFSDRLTKLLVSVGLKNPTTVDHLFYSADVLPVLESLVDDRSVRVRRGVLGYLMQLPASPEVDAVIFRLLEDPDATVRAATLLAVHRREFHHEIWRPDLKEALPRLTTLLDDPDGRC